MIGRPPESAALWNGEQLATRFDHLTDLLRRNELIWRPSPFKQPQPTWCAAFPSLTAGVLDLSDADLDALETQDDRLHAALAAHIPDLEALARVWQGPPSTMVTHTAQLPLGFEWGMPGRKWQQVSSFAATVARDTEPARLPYLDWCGGKGHLSRTVCAVTGGAAIVFERSSSLCNDGEQAAKRHRLPIRFANVDVRSEMPLPHAHTMALHACGHLHQRLIDLADPPRWPTVHLAPCCYHLAPCGSITMSSQARRDGLQLDAEAAHIAVEESVTAGQRRNRLRAQEVLARFAFDLWQRDVRGVDDYLPVPSLPRGEKRADLGRFVRWAATHHGLPEPSPTQIRRLHEGAVQRKARWQRLSLPRHAFRRALELYLVLDRALALADRGYAVSVSTFCARVITPRNLLIAARA